MAYNKEYSSNIYYRLIKQFYLSINCNYTYVFVNTIQIFYEHKFSEKNIIIDNTCEQHTFVQYIDIDILYNKI